MDIKKTRRKPTKPAKWARRAPAAIAAIVDTAASILAEYHPQTVRQVFYALVSRLVIENTFQEYSKLKEYLKNARLDRRIAWELIEDRTRQPRIPNQWDSLADYLETVSCAYQLSPWPMQPRRVELWVEKDALSGVFMGPASHYKVTLNVGKGYDSWSSIYEAAQRFKQQETVVLCFGDFDASGIDIYRSQRKRFKRLGCEVDFIRCALLEEDIERYNLPPTVTKSGDTRAAKHIAKYGEMSAVELDALPRDILIRRIETEIEKQLDMEAFQATVGQQKAETVRLIEFVKTFIDRDR